MRKRSNKQVVLDGVQVRDLERIGHQGPGAGAAPGPDRDVVVLGPVDEVGDDQEVAGKAHLVNDVELQLQTLVVGLAPLAEIRRLPVEDVLQAPLQSLAGLVGEELLHAHAFRNREVRKEILAQGQLQVAALGDLDAVLQRLGDVGEEHSHLLGRAQVLLLAVQAGAARVVQGPTVVDTDAGLMGVEVLCAQEPHIVGRHHRDALAGGETDAELDAFGLVLAPGADQLQVVTVAEDLEPAIEQGPGLFLVAGEQRTRNIPLRSAREGD